MASLCPDLRHEHLPGRSLCTCLVPQLVCRRPGGTLLHCLSTAGLARSDPTGPGETEKESLRDDPLPQGSVQRCRSETPNLLAFSEKGLHAYPKSCGLRVSLLIQHTSRDQGRHSAETEEPSRNSFHTVSAPLLVSSAHDTAEKSWCAHLAPWVLRCHREGTSPDSLALMARDACVPGFNGTAAKKQFFTGYALRGQCRRSTENSSPSFSHKMSISIHYKLLPEGLASFGGGGGSFKIF